MKVVIIGGGVVGKSLAAVLSIAHETTVLDADYEVVLNINRCQELNYDATVDPAVLGSKDLGLIFVAVPTPTSGPGEPLDLSIVDSALATVTKYADATTPTVICSTVGPEEMENYGLTNRLVIHMPEFIRGDTAFDLVSDMQFPDRIVLGSNKPIPDNILEVLVMNREFGNLYHTSLAEAALIKLASNAYLAMRQVFFTELDAICDRHDADYKRVVQGVCSDKRIGFTYNEPNHKGDYGHCLPKDTSAYFALTRSHYPGELSQSEVFSAILKFMKVKV